MIDPGIETDAIKSTAPEDVQLRLRFMFDQRALAQDQLEGYQQAATDLESQLKETYGLLGLQHDLLADIENEIKTLQLEVDLDTKWTEEDESTEADSVVAEPPELENKPDEYEAPAPAAPEGLTLDDLLPNAAEIRKTADWSQGDVAIELGFDRATGQSKVSSWERGVRVPSGELGEAYRTLLLRLRG